MDEGDQSPWSYGAHRGSPFSGSCVAIPARHFPKESIVPRGDKSSYTDKQKRQAEHIEESYESRGVSKKEAEGRAWATVNKETGGGKKSGSGRGHSVDHSAWRKGGRLGGKASASRTADERSASAKKAAATRKRNAEAAKHE
ncbi:plasmid stabilization protein [Comamonas sp. 4034]|uniref:plasmid stabilization protein n=1 Tax=Comamonas sp. 4034 TaxID=3156455 RepID=UPI003D1ECFF9